jgi:hypothetical protein
MSWAIGFDNKWQRDIGYGVPAICDHPECNKEIDRGLNYVCTDQEPYGGDGCGLFFCSEHRGYVEDGCDCEHIAFDPKPDVSKWVEWKLTDESWQRWRDENPEQVAEMRARLATEADCSRVGEKGLNSVVTTESQRDCSIPKADAGQS